MKYIADRLSLIPPSGTMQILEKAKALEAQGLSITHLDIGEPDFSTPKPIVDAAKTALTNGKTKYTSSRGILPLREAIGAYLAKRNVNYSPQTEILVTPGSKHCLYTTLQAAINPGDEVLVLTPAWPTYFSIVGAAGGKTVEVEYNLDGTLDEEILKSSISEKTRMILINSPNNPTGAGFGLPVLKALAEIAIDHDLLVVSDEIYGEICYDSFKHVSIAELPGMKERTILVDGFSKTYAMTGWRIGYLAGPAAIVKSAAIIQQASTSCAADFTQHAAVTALTDPSVVPIVSKMVAEYQDRRNYVTSQIGNIPQVSCSKPAGAFYVFIKYPEALGPSSQVASEILTDKRVSCTPGSAFGKVGEYHLRLSYAASMQVLEKGMQGISNYITSKI